MGYTYYHKKVFELFLIHVVIILDPWIKNQNNIMIKKNPKKLLLNLMLAYIKNIGLLYLFGDKNITT